MILTGPPPPKRSDCRPPEDRRETRAFWRALWVQSVTVIGGVLIALVGLFQGCGSISEDVEAIKDSLELRDRAIELNARRAEAAEREAQEARIKATEALARSRENEALIESYSSQGIPSRRD